MEAKKLNPQFPWRGRVVHVRSHRATKVKFDESLNESISTYDEFSDLDEMIDLAHADGDRKLKSILKRTNFSGPDRPMEPYQNGDEQMTQAHYPLIEDIAEVLKFLRRENRVPRLAFSQKFRAAETRAEDMGRKLDDIIPYLLDEGYLEEKIYHDLRHLEISRTCEKQRLEVLQYKDEYKSGFVDGLHITASNINRVTKGTYMTGIARKLFADNTVLMASAADSGRISSGEQYEVMLDGKLERIQCRKQLRAKIWQVLVLRDASYHVVAEEKIKRHMNNVKTHTLHFLGRRPIQDELFIAQVEAIGRGIFFTTLKDESFLSHLIIRLPSTHTPAQARIRAVACRGQLLLACADLEELVTSFGLSLSEHLKHNPKVLYPLCVTQRFILSTYKKLTTRFDDTNYITSCDLACLLDKSENSDALLVRELLLI